MVVSKNYGIVWITLHHQVRYISKEWKIRTLSFQLFFIHKHHYFCLLSDSWLTFLTQKIKFFIKIFSVNVTKSAVFGGFGHINGKLYFLCAVFQEVVMLVNHFVLCSCMQYQLVLIDGMIITFENLYLKRLVFYESE